MDHNPIDGAAEPGNNNRGHQQRHHKEEIVFEETAKRGGCRHGMRNCALIDSGHSRPHDGIEADVAFALKNLERRNVKSGTGEIQFNTQMQDGEALQPRSCTLNGSIQEDRTTLSESDARFVRFSLCIAKRP